MEQITPTPGQNIGKLIKEQKQKNIISGKVFLFLFLVFYTGTITATGSMEYVQLAFLIIICLFNLCFFRHWQVNNKRTLSILFLLMALLFNPIYRLLLSASLWKWIVYFNIFLLIVDYIKISRSNEEPFKK